jgi:hypothetical protein
VGKTSLIVVYGYPTKAQSKHLRSLASATDTFLLYNPNHISIDLSPLIGESYSGVYLDDDSELAVFAAFQDAILRFISSIYEKFPRAWACRFAEGSFSDSIWQDYYRVLVIQRICAQHHIRSVFLLGEISVELRRGISENIDISATQIRENFWSERLRILLYRLRVRGIWLANFLTEISAYFFSFVARKIYQSDIIPDSFNGPIVASFFTNNWRDNDGLQLRFLGSVGTSHKDKIGFFVSSLHANRERVRGIRQSLKCRRLSQYEKNIFLLEDYLCLRDVFISYFGRQNKEVAFAISKTCRESGLIFMETVLIERSIWVDLPKQISLQRAAENFFSKAAAPKKNPILVPVFELVEERALVSAARKLGFIVTGMQHAANGMWGSTRLVETTGLFYRNESQAVPNRVLVEGQFHLEKFLRAGFSDVCIVGAPRIRAQAPPFSLDKYQSAKIFAVLLEVHNWHTGLDFALSLAEEMSSYSVILRPHPKKINEVVDYLDSLKCPSNISVDQSDSLVSFITKSNPKVVFSRESGSGVELAAAGWPIFLMDAEFSRSLNPLVFAGQGLYTISRRRESLGAVTDFINGDVICEYTQAMRASATSLISNIGFEADQNLVNYLFND